MNTDKCHVMIDLETLSRHSNAAILSVGAVLFGLEPRDEPEELYHMGVDLKTAMDAGLHIESDTINWWLNQKSENQDRLLAMQRKSLYTVLEELATLVKRHTTKCYVWGHGSIFDITILENAYKAIRKEIFWDYKNVRDTRTFFDVCEYTYKAKGGHDALDDAMNQAVGVREAYKQLFGYVEYLEGGEK